MRQLGAKQILVAVAVIAILPETRQLTLTADQAVGVVVSEVIAEDSEVNSFTLCRQLVLPDLCSAVEDFITVADEDRLRVRRGDEL